VTTRYQVFISSTFADLQEERAKVIQTIMELDCIPAGMEAFPAIDEEQFEFIKKVIDDCDYYLLIIGGRYGSISEDGFSYTEKEYDYAISKDIKVMAFLHKDPESLPYIKSEGNADSRQKLTSFREKVAKNRLIKFWNSAEELPGLVALSLPKTIKTYPALGWVRAGGTSDPQVYKELNDLRKENQVLNEKLDKLTHSAQISDLAALDEYFTIHGKYSYSYKYPGTTRLAIAHDTWELSVSWADIFAAVSPLLREGTPSGEAERIFASQLLKKLAAKKDNIESPSIDYDDFLTITIQLQALGLLENDNDFIALTDAGRRKMIELRTVRTAK